MTIHKNFTSTYSKDWEINFLQCYPNGNLKYTELCNLLQLTAGEHADLGGLSFSDMQYFDQAWVLSRMLIEISTLPKWRDTITVTTWITDMKGSRSVRALEIHLNGKKIAGSTTFWAVLNTKKRIVETIQLPFNHFTVFPDRLPTQQSFAKLNLTLDGAIIKEKTVQLSDLDIVNHANNVKYLEWCLDSMPTGIILQSKIQSLDMNFLKELHLKDRTVITEYKQENTVFYKISKSDKVCFALKIDVLKDEEQN